jgi:hypothetical protein
MAMAFLAFLTIAMVFVAGKLGLMFIEARAEAQAYKFWTARLCSHVSSLPKKYRAVFEICLDNDNSLSSKSGN